MSNNKHRFKIPSLGIKDGEFNKMAFGRQIEFFKKIEEFKNGAKKNHFDQKGKTFAAGLREFCKLYEVKEFYCIDRNGQNWKDDSTEIWYK